MSDPRAAADRPEWTLGSPRDEGVLVALVRGTICGIACFCFCGALFVAGVVALVVGFVKEWW